MKMFKMLSVVVAMLFVFGASYGLACEGNDCPGERQAYYGTGQGSFNAYEWRDASSSTGNQGNNNDYSNSSSWGNAGGRLDVNADASGYTRILWWKIDNPAIAFGSYNAENEDNAWAWSKDYGKTSKAGAGAVSEGEAFTFGTAIGLQGCRETVESNVYVEGNVYQFNTAGETGYSENQFAQGENDSGGFYRASNHEFTDGWFNGLAIGSNYIEGKIITQGMTEVTIDPNGNNRSFNAMTENMVKVEQSGNLMLGNVGGFGQVAGLSQGYGSWASGSASFNYVGQTSGSGNAHIQGQVNNGTTFSSVSGSGYAFSTSHGTPDALQALQAD